MEQLKDNLAALDVKLSEDQVKKLDDVSTLPPEYPGWMLPFQGANRLEPAAPRPGIPVQAAAAKQK
jgi:diketogulonate reductase-like aldo/keto reductase